MKLFITSAFFLAANLLFAAPSLGTKKDILVSPPSSGTPSVIGGGEMVQMVLALLVVAALLKWILPKLVGMMGKKISTNIGGTIKIEETANFGAGQLHIVKVRDRVLLLSVTQSGVQFLSDVTPSAPAPVEAPAFFEMMDRAEKQSEETLRRHAVVSTASDEMSMAEATDLIERAKHRMATRSTGKSPDEIKKALGRLERLTS